MDIRISFLHLSFRRTWQYDRHIRNIHHLLLDTTLRSYSPNSPDIQRLQLWKETRQKPETYFSLFSV